MLEDIFELIVGYVFGVVVKKIFFWPGWLLLKVVTLGRHPRPQAAVDNRMPVAIVGFIACLCLTVLWVVLRNRAA